MVTATGPHDGPTPPPRPDRPTAVGDGPAGDGPGRAVNGDGGPVGGVRDRAVTGDGGPAGDGPDRATGRVAGRLLRAAVVPTALVAAIGLAGVVLNRVYAGDLLIRLVCGAALGAVLVSVAARRLPSWLVAPLSVAAMLGATAWSVRLAADQADLPGGFLDVTADAAGNAVPRLLTAMIPVEPAPDTVLVPVVAAWLAGLAGAEVALRAGRVLLGFLPATSLYVGAVYVVGPNAEPAIWPTVAFAGLVAVALAGGRAPGADPTAGLPPGVRATVRVRATAVSAAGVAVVVGLAALLGPVLAGWVDHRPVDPRRYVPPPRVESLDENPLIRISGWALDPQRTLLDVSTRAPAGGSTTIRLAVLSDYDGVTWRVGATYRTAGRVLPVTDPGPGVVDTVRQEITVAGLTGRLLPAVATPRSVDGARVAYDPESGTLIRPEGLVPGLTYTVTSAREQPEANLLGTADVPAGAEVARVLRVADGTPEPLRRLAAQLAEENGAPYARAAAVEQFLAEHYRLVADAPSGHAYPNLEFFLFGPRGGGGQRGTSEQFAAAFAVLGRLTGLPTRVVVGFTSRGDGPVRAADAYAWPEVLFAGVGWVPFDPRPRPDDTPRPVEEDFRPAPQSPPPSEVPEPTPTTPTTPPAVAAPAREVEDRGGRAALLVGAGTGGLLLAGVALGVLAWRRRAQTRTRLTRGDPGTRVGGAWRHTTDALRLSGRPVGGELSATEVADRARHALAEDAGRAGGSRPAGGSGRSGNSGGGDPVGLAELAGLLNQAAFAPGTLTDAQADRARRIAEDYATALRAARPRWRRLLWSVRPGPLRWPR
ncbi:transglutaminaseTgpA domain-containing protein [Micromonospora matsumotoense]|uniref:transglutaminaseTgpA domain-containing protein n=1 Tax=Micromonospora matsumotoense TaxID=121616 RepID=UPI0033EB0661